MQQCPAHGSRWPHQLIRASRLKDQLSSRGRVLAPHRIFHTNYRRSYRTYCDAYDAARGLFFFSLTWGFE